MIRSPDMPSGSIIRQRSEPDGLTFYWRQPQGGVFRYLVAGFLILWLCGWVAGEAFAIHELLVGSDNGEVEGQGFLLFWLAGWSLGGCFAIWMLYRVLRPPLPESVFLGYDSFRYDSGSACFMFVNPWETMSQWQKGAFPWPRRQRISVSKSEAGPFVLERTGEHQRLRFDYGADRVEIGRCLREPEREWLATVIEAWQTRR